MTIGSLFSGIGGLERGLEMCGLGPVIWQAESDPYARAVLATHWPAVHRFADVREIDAQSPPPDIICGGFPCQDISNAGKRIGIGGARSGLWSEFARIVRDLRPRVVFVENVAALVARGIDVVLGDLAACGFDAEWGMFRASDVGAPHRRERVFILAYAGRVGLEWLQSLAESWGGDSAAPGGGGEAVSDADGSRRRDAEDAGSDRGHAGAGAEAEGWRAAGGEQSQRGGSLADAIGEAGRSTSGLSLCGDGTAALRDGEEESGRRGGDVADAASDAGGLHPGRWPEGPRTVEPERASEGVGLADTDRERRQARRPAPQDRQQRRSGPVDDGHRFPPGPGQEWDGPQPAIRRGDDGIPRRVDRLRCLGNAVVPQCAALAWRTLTARAQEQRA